MTTYATFTGMMNAHVGHEFDLSVRQDKLAICYYDVWCRDCEVILIPDVPERREADDWVEEMTAWVKLFPNGQRVECECCGVDKKI